MLGYKPVTVYVVIFEGCKFHRFCCTFAKREIFALEKKQSQCMYLHGQQINHENPFMHAFCKIYVPQKLPRIRYIPLHSWDIIVITFRLGFTLVLCNNNDIPLIVRYNYNIRIHIYKIC